MFASGVQGCPVAGCAQTRTLAPARGMPRVLNTMSSLRVPCACTGATAPGTRCSASISHAQKIPIVVARVKRAAILDRIITIPFSRGRLDLVAEAKVPVLQKFASGDGDLN